MTITQNGVIRPGVPNLEVVFRNVTEHDVNINLGYVGGWSPRPCKLDNREISCTFNFTLNVSDSTGARRRYTFRGIAFIGGLIDSYIVYLRPHHTYTLDLGIDQFYSPATQEYQPLALAPGAYKLSLEFEGLAPGFSNVNPQYLAKMNFWKGKLTSNVLSIEMAGVGPQTNPQKRTLKRW